MKRSRKSREALVRVLIVLLILSSTPIQTLAETVSGNDAQTDEVSSSVPQDAADLEESSEVSSGDVGQIESGVDSIESDLADMNGETVIPNDETGIPDPELYATILKVCDGRTGNQDQILTVEETKDMNYLSLPLSVRDYAGLGEYMTDLQQIYFEEYSYDGSYLENFWEEAADSFFTECEKLSKLTAIDNAQVADSGMLERFTEKETLEQLTINVKGFVEDYSSLFKLNLRSLSLNGGYDVEENNDLSFLNAANFPNLTYLGVGLFDIPEMPEGIGGMTSLETLSWGVNKTRKLADLKGLDNLTYLSLNGNYLTAEEILEKVSEKFAADDSFIKNAIDPSYDPELDEYYEENRAVVTNDANGIPDPVLYEIVLREGDANNGNGDGLLTVAEAKKLQWINLPKSIQDYTGLGKYLPRLASIGFEDVYPEEENQWEKAADSFLSEYEKLTQLNDLYNVPVANQNQLEKISNKEKMTYLSLRVKAAMDDYSVLAKMPLENLQIDAYMMGGDSAIDGSAFSTLKAEDFPELQNLRISGFDVPEMPEGIAGFVNLQQLDWSSNQTRKLADLTGLTNLSSLYISGNFLLEEEIRAKVPEKFQNDESWMQSAINSFYDKDVDEYYEENRAVIKNDASGIPDAALYALALQRGDEWQGNKDGILTVAEARKVTDISLYYSIQDYTGLGEFLPRLNSIIFAYSDAPGAYNENHWTDAAASFFEEYRKLSQLEYVRSIQIDNDQMLNAVTEKTELKGLSMQSGSEITDWSGLVKMNLEELTIQGSCPDFEVLSDMADTLIALSLYRYYDEEPIAYDFSAFTKLARLSLQGRIASVSGLDGKSSMTEIYLTNNSTEDGYAEIGALPTSLQYLSLTAFQVKEVSGTMIPQMKDLTSLVLSDTELQALDGVEGLEKLYRLDISNNQIVDLSPLKNLTELYSFYASNNQIEDISVLGGLTKLVELHLANNKIKDASSLGNLPLLEALNLSNNQLTALPDLSGLDNLGNYYINRMDGFNVSGNLLTKEAVKGHVPAAFENNLLWMLNAVSRNINGRKCYGDLNARELNALIYEYNQGGTGFSSYITVMSGSQVEMPLALYQTLAQNRISLTIGFVDETGMVVENHNLGINSYFPVSEDLVLSDRRWQEVSSEDKALAEKLYAHYEVLPQLLYFQADDASLQNNQVEREWNVYLDGIAENGYYAIYFYDREKGEAEYVRHAGTSWSPSLEGKVYYLYLTNYTTIWNSDSQTSEYVLDEKMIYPASKGFYFLSEAQYSPSMPTPEPEDPTEPSETPEPEDPTEPSETPEPGESTAPSESTDPSESTEPSESTDPSESTAPSESTDPSESTEPSESTAPSESIEPSESTAPSESTEPGESTEPEESTEPGESTEPEESTEPSESTEPEESAESSEASQPSAVLPEPGKSLPIEISEVESVENAEDIIRDKIQNEYGGRASVAVSGPTTLSKDVFQDMMETGKGLSVSVTNENNEKLYEWSFNSSQLDADKFVDLDLTVKFETEAKERIEAITGQTNAFYMSFNHHGDLPAPATMTVYVGDHYKDGEVLYLYYYNEETQQVESIQGSGYVVVNGYVTYTITHCSDYFLATNTPAELGVSVIENVNEAILTGTLGEAVSPETGDSGFGAAGWMLLCGIIFLTLALKMSAARKSRA